MTRPTKMSPSESRALAVARRALGRARLGEAAAAYEAAAKAREAGGGDGIAHRIRALEFWAASGAVTRGLTAARRVLSPSSGADKAQRGIALRVRATLLLAAGDPEGAAAAFASARRLLVRDSTRWREATLGLAGALLRLGRSGRARTLLKVVFRESESSGDLWGAVNAAHGLGTLFLGSRDPWGALPYLEVAAGKARAAGLLSLEASATRALSQAQLSVGLTDDARSGAERAASLATEPEHSPEADRALLVESAALRKQIQDYAPEMVSASLERRIVSRLDHALRRWQRRKSSAGEALCRLEIAATLARTGPSRAAQEARGAEAALARLGLEAEALSAREAHLRARGQRARPDQWVALGKAAESEAEWNLARVAWTEAARAAQGRRGPGADDRGRVARGLFLRALREEAEGIPAAPSLERAVEPAFELAWLLADREPEPKEEALGWLLTGMRFLHSREAWEARAPVHGPQARARAKLALLSWALLEANLTSPSSRADRRSQASAASNAIRAERRRAKRELARTSKPRLTPEPTGFDHLAPEEALFVFARREDEVHAWAAEAGRPPRTHVRLGSVSVWRSALSDLAPQVRDASGWPDAVVPDSLTRACLETLGRLAAAVWVPLWPALAGKGRVLIVCDPRLPALPWNALLLLAGPAALRPRALSLMPSLPRSRPREWRIPGAPALALAGPSGRVPSAEREARAVSRILGGDWAWSSVFGQDESSTPGRLNGRVLHMADVTTVHPLTPSLSALPLGEDGLPLWRLVREKVRFPLAVFPYCQVRAPLAPTLGRVVGRVGPEGARATGSRPQARAPASLEDAGGLARALVTTGTRTAVVNSWPYEPSASAGVVGSFYAGLARGDSPGESLLAAQRRALEEGLHPAAWAGFASWGWT